MNISKFGFFTAAWVLATLTIPAAGVQLKIVDKSDSGTLDVVVEIGTAEGPIYGLEAVDGNDWHAATGVGDLLLRLLLRRREDDHRPALGDPADLWRQRGVHLAVALVRLEVPVSPTP